MVSPASHLRSVTSRDGAAIFNDESSEVIRLNSTGAFVWERLQQGRSLEDIARELTAQTGGTATTIDSEVRAFTEELKRHRLLES